MIRAVLVLLALLVAASVAQAQPPGAQPRGAQPRGAQPPGAQPRGAQSPGAPAPADVLLAAGRALAAGESERAANLAGRVAREPRPIARQDRAEAWRILGLAHHALGRRDQAAAALHAYLVLDPDARLDPALVPPQVIAFFEEVRAQHAAELAALRPRPARRGSMLLNFVPLGGQWQNGERTKVWVLGSAGAALLAVNIASYVTLRGWCRGPGGTCDEGLPGMPGYVDHTVAARRMQVVNVASGVGLLVLYSYSVIDGIHGYRRRSREEARQTAAPVALGVEAGAESVLLVVGGGF